MVFFNKLELELQLEGSYEHLYTHIYFLPIFHMHTNFFRRWCPFGKLLHVDGGDAILLSSVYYNCWDISGSDLNPRPYSLFCHLRPCRGGGGWCDPPWRSAPDGRRASRKKPVDAPRRDLAIAHIVFGPRLIFDLVRSGQSSNFREK